MTWTVNNCVEWVQDAYDQALALPPGMGIASLAANDGSWAPYLRFLYLLAQHVPSTQRILELGTYAGLSAAHLALGNPESFVCTVDLEPQADAYKWAEQLGNLSLIVGDSCAVKERVSSWLHGRQIGLLFLDTEHDGETPARELATYVPYLSDVAFVVIDDLLGPAHLCSKMMNFWNALDYVKFELHALHPRRTEPGIAYHDEPGFGVVIWERI